MDCVPAAKPFAGGGALEGRRTVPFSRLFRHEPGKDGAPTVKGRRGMNARMSHPPAHRRERDERGTLPHSAFDLRATCPSDPPDTLMDLLNLATNLIQHTQELLVQNNVDLFPVETGMLRQEILRLIRPFLTSMEGRKYYIGTNNNDTNLIPLHPS